MHALSSLTLPIGAYQRVPPRGTRIKDKSFWERYDSQTLIYDVYHCPKRQQVRVILPRTFNLAALVKTATFAIDGMRATRFKWRKWRRHEMLVFSGLPQARRMTVTIEGVENTLPINPINTNHEGLNCLTTLSKDNDLAWVQDWARFHVRQHGLQALVICDNGSMAYTIKDLHEAAMAVDGIQAVSIVKAGLPFGPLNKDCTNRSDAKFLQVAMLNLVRDRFLRGSRAWLNLDIDELLLSPTGESIFDATVNNRWGHLTFPGVWHYPTDDAETPTYANHRLIRPGDSPCPTKYSLRPDGPFGDFALQVHSLDRIHRKFSFAPKRFWFMHCHGISTSWKYARTAPKGPFSPASDLAQKALDAGFGK